MLFPTVEFGIFFFIVFALSWLLKDKFKSRKVILLIASYIFYGWWDWRFTFLLFLCSFGNYLFGLAMSDSKESYHRKVIVAISVVWNLTILGFFKYYGFFVSSFNNLMSFINLGSSLPVLNIILPVGISFFTFQAMSYVIDVYRKEIPPSKSLVDVMLFVSFFPQLVAGPIVRAKDFIPQLSKKPDPKNIPAARAFVLISAGLFKKVIIANYLATEIVDPVFETPSSYSALDALFAVYGYAVQIYCDFSAYSEIAIGIAALLGYYFQDNFNYPYRAQSIKDFWRRWHISLSTWLRDYLYIPLGGSKKGRFRTYVNLAITMLLGGLWHGAAWNFVFWGALHGFGLGIERFFIDKFGERKHNVLWQILSTAFVFHFVCLSWIFFRSRSFSLSMEYFRAFGNISREVSFVTPFVFLLVLVGIAMHFTPSAPGRWVRLNFNRLPTVVQGIILGILLLMISAFGPEGVAPFIYFRF
ncbi:MBOAT family protein [candidate division WOR-3 bacterium]|nr:MBOAT family protein [candidate division WOR-3 bacterium]